MITKNGIEKAKKRAGQMLKKAKIAITKEEYKNMEVVDAGLGDLKNIGVEIIIYENNERYCAKELILFPRQICPEHRHPPLSESNPGKQETFRCRWGKVYLYVPGEPVKKPKARLKVRKQYFTVWHEIILKPGGQYTLSPDTLHWFQAGDKGAIVSEFSSYSNDETDLFTDTDIKRRTEIQ
ncbi:MAG: D-lyxose/D-mannose family sugar isomerase [Candidatus Omnitrophica bacterium]|nr:D-lyxose/D-mannose family sugar isomerase [Candidatus Omnitrophota bacterium]